MKMTQPLSLAVSALAFSNVHAASSSATTSNLRGTTLAPTPSPTPLGVSMDGPSMAPTASTTYLNDMPADDLKAELGNLTDKVDSLLKKLDSHVLWTGINHLSITLLLLSLFCQAR